MVWKPFTWLRETNTLRRSLAFYFLPISIIPVIVISIYAAQVVQKTTNETLAERADSTRDVLIADFDSLSQRILTVAKSHANHPILQQKVIARHEAGIRAELENFGGEGRRRVFAADGTFIAAVGKSTQDVDYLSREAVKIVKKKGQWQSFYFLPEENGFVQIVRVAIAPKAGRIVGILEEEVALGREYLVGLKAKRGVDMAVFDPKFTSAVGSFAVPQASFQPLFQLSIRQTGGPVAPHLTHLGDERYSTFLYPLPSDVTGKSWGYLAVFMSMTKLDLAVGSLRQTMIYLALLLVLMASLLIFVFSNRLVRPIEALVAAMKRAKGGQVDEIPDLQSTVEIEYLVRSFNVMARSVAQSKNALEAKLQELHRANQEIQQAQSTLVQNAKMASIGQMVAGVAHELNNPIGFIYSNMHHLSEYAQKLRKVMDAYQAIHPRLTPEDRQAIEKTMETLEVEFILKDIEDLTRSCLDGAQRTKDIVLGLRTFSRIDDESVFRPADLIDGLRSTIRLLQTDFKQRITVHEKYAELPLVECNPSQINQVFMNVLSNAGQAIAQKGDIWIEASVQDGQVVIEIEDSGPGMDKKTMDQIFDPFFTTKKVGDGTGLGLSIAYGLIQKHHGSIAVASEQGVGTRFTITLPITQPVSLSASS